MYTKFIIFTVFKIHNMISIILIITWKIYEYTDEYTERERERETEKRRNGETEKRRGGERKREREIQGSVENNRQRIRI